MNEKTTAGEWLIIICTTALFVTIIMYLTTFTFFLELILSLLLTYCPVSYAVMYILLRREHVEWEKTHSPNPMETLEGEDETLFMWVLSPLLLPYSLLYNENKRKVKK